MRVRGIGNIRAGLIRGGPSIAEPEGDTGLVHLAVRWTKDGKDYAGYMTIPEEAVEYLKEKM